MRLPYRMCSTHTPSYGGGAASATETSRAGGRFRPGEYLASAKELFQVEECGERRAIVENCLSGDRFDVALEELRKLRHVEAAAL